MHIIVRCILFAVFLALVYADCYSQGSQRFCEPTLTVPQVEQNYGTKDALLYLTPSQVQMLEANGYVLKLEENEEYPPENEQEEEQVENEESEQITEQENTENTEDQVPREILELKEIFKILNQQIAEYDKKKYGDYWEYVSQRKNGEDDRRVDNKEEHKRVKYIREQKQRNKEEKQTVNFRRIPARFGVLKRYITSSALRKQILQQNNNYNTLSNHRRFESLHQGVNKESKTMEVQNINEKNNTLQDKHKIDIIVDELKEQPQEEINQKEDLVQDNFASETPILSNHNLVQSIVEYRDKLNQNEIQFLKGFQELKQSPINNNQKYAIEIERLRTILEQQNALARADFLAKTTPFLRKEQLDTKNIQVDNKNQEKLSPRFNNFAGSALRKLQINVPFQVRRPIPVPVIKASRIELKTRVPVETDNLALVAASKDVYVPIASPYIMERVDPVEINKQLISIRKPEEVTIIRHLWEH